MTYETCGIPKILIRIRHCYNERMNRVYANFVKNKCEKEGGAKVGCWNDNPSAAYVPVEAARRCTAIGLGQ